jgi:hypothetical protein
MDYRSNLAFGVFVAIVAALAVGVVLLLSDGGGDDASDAEAPAKLALPCELESKGVRIVLSPGGGSCAEARAVYMTFRGMARREEIADAYEPSPVGEWTCQEYPLAEYPLLARCSRNRRQFDVLGTAPSAHQGEEAYQVD